MQALKAHVRRGRVVVDTPVRFPDGTKFKLIVADDGDDLDESERAALHAALQKSWRARRPVEQSPVKSSLHESKPRDDHTN